MSIRWFSNKMEFAEFINYGLDEINNGHINKALFEELIKKQLLWDWSEHTLDWKEESVKNKLHTIGCGYWTKDALDKCFILGPKTINKKSGDSYYERRNDITDIKKLVTHEHVIPKKIIASDIMSFKNDPKRNEEMIYDYLQKYALACVVTKEENKKLDSEKLRSNLPGQIETAKNTDNPWVRYISIDIKDVCECTWKKIGNKVELVDYETISLLNFNKHKNKRKKRNSR